MFTIAAGIWAAAVLAVYEIRFPLPFRDAFLALWACPKGAGHLLATTGPLKAALAAIFAAVVFGVIQAACWGAGRAVHHWLGSGIRDRDPAAGLVRLLLGWLAAGLAIFGLALAGLFHPFAFILLTGVLLVFAVPDMNLLNGLRFPSPDGPLSRAIRIAVVLVAAATVVCMLAPAADIDALIMHLALPERCLKLHKFAPMPANFLFDLPAPAEMLTGWALALGGEKAARLWGLAGMAAGACAVFTVMRPLCSETRASIGAALWFTSPFLCWLALSGKPDLMTGPFILAATGLVMNRKVSRRSAFAAGILAGAAVSFKLPALGPGVIIAGLMLFDTRGRRTPASPATGVGEANPWPASPATGVGEANPWPASPATTGRAMAQPAPVIGPAFFLAGLGAAAAPWMAKSLLLYRDPVYPFGRCGYGVSPVAVGMALDFGRVAAIRGHYDTVFQRLISPWTATMTDELSPVWLALAPIVLITMLASNRAGTGPAPLGQPGTRVRILGIAGFLAWLGWLLGPPQTRYAVPALSWLMVAGLAGVPAMGAGKASAGDAKRIAPASLAPLAAAGRFFPLLAGAFIVLQATRICLVAVSTGSLYPAFGLESREDYLAPGLGTYDQMLADLDRRLPRGARVLLVGERRTYPAPRLLSAASIHEPFPVYPLIRASANTEELARRIRQLGAGHIVHNHVAALYNRAHQAIYPWSQRDLAVWADFWRRYVRLIAMPERLDVNNGGYYIYRLARARAAPLPTPTLPGIEGMFSTAEEWFKEGKLEKVAEITQMIEQVAGDFASVKYFIGGVWYSADSYKSAGYLMEADAGGLRNLLLWESLAQQEEARWQLEEALMYREKIARFAPGVGAPPHVRLLMRLAAKGRKLGKIREAEKYLKRAVEVDDLAAGAWADLAEVELALGRRVAAESAARRAVRLDRRNSGYRDVLGRIMKTE